MSSDSETSLTSFRTASPHHPVFSSVSEKSPCGRERVKGETPRLTPRGDKKGARGDLPFLSFRAKREISSPCLPKEHKRRGTPRFARGDISHFVLPRRVSAEGPLRFARGDKRGTRGDIPYPVISSEARNPSLRSGQRPRITLSFRALARNLLTLSSRGMQVPRDPSPTLGVTKKKGSGRPSFSVVSSEARNLLTLSSRGTPVPRDPSLALG
jgi:hypothetical protein